MGENEQANKFIINIPVKKYFEELKLMKKQYGQEEDLYPWIYMLLQMANKNNQISIRAVHQCRKTRSQLFCGLAGAPDFAILNKKYINKSEEELFKAIANLYGCVEIKGLKERLLDIQELFSELKTGDLKNNIKVHRYQPIGHLLWYGKVLYTNGLEWRLLKLKISKKMRNCLICILEDCNTKKLNWLNTEKAQNFLKSNNFSVENELIADLTDVFKKYCEAKDDKARNTIIEEIKENDGEWTKLIKGLANINWHEEPTTELSVNN